MPVHVTHKTTGDTCALIPAPFVNISRDAIKTGDGRLIGFNFSITLKGTLLDSKGSPVARKNNTDLFVFEDPSVSSSLGGPYGEFYIGSTAGTGSRALSQIVSLDKKMKSLLRKQEAIRSLFSQDGQTIEIVPVDGDHPIKLNPRVLSIEFSEGNWVERCEYTIQLEADTLYAEGFSNKRDDDSDPAEAHIMGSGDYISAFAEDWSIENNEQAESNTIPNTYRMTHNINATGKRHYDSNGDLVAEAWQQARDIVQLRLGSATATLSTDYPSLPPFIGSGSLCLSDQYGGFSQSRTERIDEANGSYGVVETWVLSSGNVLETYNTTIRTGSQDPFITVSIDGNITGLNTVSACARGALATTPLSTSTAYQNAVVKYEELTASGLFGINSSVFKRVNSSVGIEMNGSPISVSVASNESQGTLSYNLEFNNRPLNCITGAISETITISDTYPGDVFASIPVLGRRTGPVLQYIGTRTEYRRGFSIDLTMDYSRVPYSCNTYTLGKSKPSVTSPQAAQLATLIDNASPKYEPGIVKWFVSPSPQETWNPKEGKYTFNIEWVYELSK
jgi:hypothetical protein